MTSSRLPDHASLEYLKKLAKDRLRELRRMDPQAQLPTVQRDIAREYGFPGWRALKAELDQRDASPLDALFAACAAGDVGTLGALLHADPALGRQRDN